MKTKYSVKHIKALASRLTEYEEWLEKDTVPGCCIICYTVPEGKFKCKNCLIDDCDDGIRARDMLDSLSEALPFQIEIIIEWYEAMLDRANRRLKASGSDWYIDGKTKAQLMKLYKGE